MAINTNNITAQMRKGFLEYCILLILKKKKLHLRYHYRVEGSKTHCGRRNIVSSAYTSEKQRIT